MRWFSYHGGHSGEFCRHAKGTLRGVVERAAELGFTHYGLSEHCPRERMQDLFEEEAAAGLSPADLRADFERYVREALRLRDAYAERLEVLVGFETERLPPGDWAERMRALRTSAPFDYIVGSVHDVGGVFIDYDKAQTDALAERLGGVEALQQRYFEAVVDLVEVLRPEIVGHLDLVRKFDGPNAGFSPHIMTWVERALEAVRAAGSVLDVNCGAHRRGLSPVYPLPAILERARAMGIGVTLGDDSHGAGSVGAGLDACVQAIARAGYREIHYLARTDGEVRWQSAPLDDVRPQPPSHAS